MKAIEDTRLQDVGRLDRVKVKCPRCGRITLLYHQVFHGMASDTLLLDMAPRFKCEGCGAQDAIVSVRWAGV